MRNTKLPPDLQAAWNEIDGYARQYGLDYYPISYEVLDYRTLYEVASFGGFPTRYPHWRFGMEFDQMIKGHTYGLSVIYEMVINNNPSYAYLLEGNDLTTQKMVMAHVTGHVDFFKNNLWFSHTNRHMLDTMANHAVRIQKLVERHGYEPVEDFIDICLSLENLIDYHAPYIRRRDAQSVVPVTEEELPEELPEGLKVDRRYMQGYINPPEFLESERRKLAEERDRHRNFPEHPQKDVLLFLLNYAPLERWQHTVLEIVRDEMYYFAPQAMTKILNEGWACLSAGSLVFTERGLLPIEQIVQQRQAIGISDGQTVQQSYDWAAFHDRLTVKLKTRRGFELDGSATHQVMLPDGAWRRLDQLKAGDQVALTGGQNLWPETYIELEWQPAEPSLWQHVDGFGTSWHGTQTAMIAPFLARSETATITHGKQQVGRTAVRVPTHVDEQLAALLGYLVDAGEISSSARTVALSTADEAQADRYLALTTAVFGVTPRKRREDRRWRVSFVSHEVVDCLAQLGLSSLEAARPAAVPEPILRSPQAVVAAFLRALYDSVGYADDAGLMVSTSSAALSAQVQLLLLNFGILSTRYWTRDGYWDVYAEAQSAVVFAEQIGFGLTHQQAQLQRYIAGLTRPQQERWSDTIVSVEHGRGDVYDMSITESHRYAAQGFINHNSYWHSEIMTKKAARASEIVDFAEHHSGVVASSPQRLNPYKLGLELLRDIEERWNKGKFGKEYEECPDFAVKRAWDRKLGLGREKLFEVRKFHNDITFIDEFLTPEFALEQKLFSFKYNRDTDLYEIASREFAEIKQKLLYRLTNFGQPFIYVEDGNYGNRGELYLRHRHEGVDLRIDYARDTLRNLQKIWTRPVHLETVIDEKKRLLTFDGRDYSERRMD